MVCVNKGIVSEIGGLLWGGEVGWWKWLKRIKRVLKFSMVNVKVVWMKILIRVVWLVILRLLILWLNLVRCNVKLWFKELYVLFKDCKVELLRVKFLGIGMLGMVNVYL